MLEALGAEQERDERDVRGVHGLQREAGAGAVEVGVVDQVLDRLQHLLQQAPLHQPEFQHLGGGGGGERRRLGLREAGKP